VIALLRAMGQDLILTDQEREMAVRTSLVALAMLLPSISGAAACDDYPEEMALAAARRDVSLAQKAPAQPASGQHSTTKSGQPVAMDAAAAAVDTTPRQLQTTANWVGALRP
jgi:hypothetical protein